MCCPCIMNGDDNLVVHVYVNVLMIIYAINNTLHALMSIQKAT